MARRQHLTASLVLAATLLLTLFYIFSSSSTVTRPTSELVSDVENKGAIAATPLEGINHDVVAGGVITPKLENATVKAELGRASWKLLHTMMARFPEKPTEDESLALKSYVHLFSRLYPCGDCARHFQKLLAKYPPQTSSRNAAAGWACFVHNEVNKRLRKPEFDCNKIGDFYDCGCGDDKGAGGKAATDTGAGKSQGSELKGRKNTSVEK